MSRPHADPGLQPERTSLAWGRTMMAMIVASLLFLRWLPAHGWFTVILVLVALATSLAIYASQRIRYSRGAAGLHTGSGRADVGAVFWTSGAVVALGALGIYTVLFLPL
ncbi:DUF202 domain-containing protein [Arthrobacter sp. H5]|uniref:DUF202 domain-containing protein n=1 Tax=Arthrobacter sp. H5 TaxID=1267973 RepID=UPI0004891456|nr:DUF202 domain-containing protein [Arthrobacter sp. H5]